MPKKLQIDRSLRNKNVDMKGAAAYRDWHWGEEAARVKDIAELDQYNPNLHLIECGRLARLHFRAPQSAQTNRIHPRRERDSKIELSAAQTMNAHVAFDKDHPSHRLYLVLPPSVKRALANRFWKQNKIAAQPLSRLAKLVGGRHATNDYPNIKAKPFGVLTGVVYYTHKRGDGPSYYLHQMGEVSGGFPIIACDAKGNLWLAGGSYTAPVAGITD